MEIGEKKQEQNKEKDRGDDKSTSEQPVNAKPTITQTEPIMEDTNVNIATAENQKDKTN